MKSLVVTTHCSGAKLPRSLEVRGVGDGEDVQGHLLIQEFGYGKIFMNSDGGQSTLDMVEALAMTGKRDKDTFPEQSLQGAGPTGSPSRATRRSNDSDP